MKMETFSYNLPNLSNVSQFVAFSVKRYCEATVHISLCYAFVNCYSIFLLHILPTIESYPVLRCQCFDKHSAAFIWL